MINEPKQLLEYLRSILGTPYKLNGRSYAEGVDCFSCTKLIQFDCFDRITPDLQIDEDTPRGYTRAVLKGKDLFQWDQVESPVHGCIVELSHGNTPHHIGTYFDIPEYKIRGLVHSLKGSGIVYDPLMTLNAAGWKRFIYNVPRPNDSAN